MIIPGFVISLFTFPGVIVHEAAHLLACRLAGVAVFDVCFFRLGNPAGYVLHQPPKRFNSSFLVGMGPFFLNSLLCVAFCSAAVVPIWQLKVFDPLSVFMMWLGLSIGMHAIPSNQDVRNIWREAGAAARAGNVLAILSFPIVAVIFVLNLLRFFWADLLYGVAIGFVGPLALFRMLAA